MVKPRYGEQSPGRLVKVGEGRVAFVPDPLPAELPLDGPAAELLAGAEYALGRLAGATTAIDHRAPVLAPLQYREALLSSRIDRIVTTPERLVITAAGINDGSPDEQAQTRSVLSCVRTLDRALVSPLPISVRLISELHAVLLAGEARAAERRDVPWDADPPPADDQSRVVRLPVREMQACLDVLESRLRGKPATIPALVELALLHYQFEAIHPFRQGNGRLGRLMLTLMLSRQQRLSSPILHLSAYLDRYRDEYFDLLRAVSERGAWLPWVRFLLRGIEESAAEAVGQVENLVELHDHYHALVEDSDMRGALQLLIDGLFVLPCISVARVVSLLDVTELIASNAIAALIAKGILFGVSGSGQGRLFLAPAILGFMRASG
jgi:Fic family protein